MQTIRDLLDHNSYCVVVTELGLRAALDRLRKPPVLVVTDSQAFERVAADTPRNIPLTSFSILFARFKGDLTTFVLGVLAIAHLKPGGRILVCEACNHHPIGDDIARVKIPRWLEQRVGGKLEFVHVQGLDFPADLSSYRLVIHCGACMLNRRNLMTRIARCLEAGRPMSNYGVVIAYCLGILERALELFPEILKIYCRATGSAG
ncbi:MAG: hypothetical protein ACUVWX_03005 [Kiritimatiellia bacterium]